MDRPHYIFRAISEQHHWEIYSHRNGNFLETKPICLHDGVTRKVVDSLEKGEPLSSQSCATIADLISLWRSDDPNACSHEWRELAPTTQRTWGNGLKRVREKWGSRALSDFDEPRIKAEIVKWRDSRSARPRSADIGVVVLQALLRFGQLRGLVGQNPADKIPSLYRGGDRAEIIWTDEDLDTMAHRGRLLGLDHAVDGLRLAALTGLRRDDLVSLTWDHVGEFAICKKARKSCRRKRRYVSIPRLPELDNLLQELRARARQPGVENVIVNRNGLPWHPDTLTRQIAIVRDTLKILHVDPESGAARKKHLHDARGTFATRLMLSAKLSDEEIGDIMGWSPTDVARIRRVYVDHSSAMIAIGRRIREGSKAAHKPPRPPSSRVIQTRT